MPHRRKNKRTLPTGKSEQRVCAAVASKSSKTGQVASGLQVLQTYAGAMGSFTLNIPRFYVLPRQQPCGFSSYVFSDTQKIRAFEHMVCQTSLSMGQAHYWRVCMMNQLLLEDWLTSLCPRLDGVLDLSAYDFLLSVMTEPRGQLMPCFFRDNYLQRISETSVARWRLGRFMPMDEGLERELIWHVPKEVHLPGVWPSSGQNVHILAAPFWVSSHFSLKYRASMPVLYEGKGAYAMAWLDCMRGALVRSQYQDYLIQLVALAMQSYVDKYHMSEGGQGVCGATLILSGVPSFALLEWVQGRCKSRAGFESKQLQAGHAFQYSHINDLEVLWAVPSSPSRYDAVDASCTNDLFIRLKDGACYILNSDNKSLDDQLAAVHRKRGSFFSVQAILTSALSSFSDAVCKRMPPRKEVVVDKSAHGRQKLLCYARCAENRYNANKRRLGRYGVVRFYEFFWNAWHRLLSPGGDMTKCFVKKDQLLKSVNTVAQSLMSPGYCEHRTLKANLGLIASHYRSITGSGVYFLPTANMLCNDARKGKKYNVLVEPLINLAKMDLSSFSKTLDDFDIQEGYFWKIQAGRFSCQHGLDGALKVVFAMQPDALASLFADCRVMGLSSQKKIWSTLWSSYVRFFVENCVLLMLQSATRDNVSRDKQQQEPRSPAMPKCTVDNFLQNMSAKLLNAVKEVHVQDGTSALTEINKIACCMQSFASNEVVLLQSADSASWFDPSFCKKQQQWFLLNDLLTLAPSALPPLLASRDKCWLKNKILVIATALSAANNHLGLSKSRHLPAACQALDEAKWWYDWSLSDLWGLQDVPLSDNSGAGQALRSMFAVKRCDDSVGGTSGLAAAGCAQLEDVLPFGCFYRVTLVTQQVVKCIYVLDAHDNLSLLRESNYSRNKRDFSHVQVAGGCPVSAAGEVYFRKENGSWRLFVINNGSGHYQPTAQSVLISKLRDCFSYVLGNVDGVHYSSYESLYKPIYAESQWLPVYKPSCKPGDHSASDLPVTTCSGAKQDILVSQLSLFSRTESSILTLVSGAFS